jgi:actin, other eukaryote
MSFDEGIQPLIFDNGSTNFRAGFSGDGTPRIVIPSMIGRPKSKFNMGVGEKDIFIGEEAQSLKEILDISYPVENGYIKNFEDMVKFFNSTPRKIFGIMLSIMNLESIQKNIQFY